MKRSGMDHSFYTANTPYLPILITSAKEVAAVGLLRLSSVITLSQKVIDEFEPNYVQAQTFDQVRPIRFWH